VTTPWKAERIGPNPYLSVDHIGAGELIVLLHGIGGNKRNWHDNLEALAAHWHAVAWDARGYGESDDYEGPLTFTDYADDLPRVLDHFGAAKAHILGLSMGGRIAMDFAERYPERLLSLTLCDTHRGFVTFTDEQRREFLRLRQEPLINGGEPKDIAPAVARSLSGPHIAPEAFAKLMDSLCRLHKQSYLKSLEATAMAKPHDRLADIRVPTHVIVGSEDKLTTPAMAQEIVDRIPGAKLTIIDDAGHLTNIEKPEAFNAAVVAFLRGL
jgi:3-oxoadipate enol-lactonase